MGDKTAIEWTDATWNPMVGCSKVSAGCDNCYAIGVAHRGMSEHHRGLTVRVEGQTEWNGEIHRAPDSVFYKPLAWKRPRRIFVNSLSDLFHPNVSTETIVEVFATMALTQRHTYQILTKRPQRMVRLLNGDDDQPGWDGRYSRDERFFVAAVEQAIIRRHPNAPFDDDHDGYLIPGVWDEDGMVWPLPNVWLGVSIENNAFAWRANHLRNTPAAIRWVSAEPLLGPLDELDLTGIDWVVAGGESGPGARPMHPDWVRDLRDRCADTAFMFKQWGAWCPDVDVATGLDAPESMSRLGKKAAGRTLDGRTWDEYPEAQQ